MGNVENKLRVEDSSIHDWYRFVLSFPPHLVQQYLETFCVDQTSFVLDPFCGTGTTNVECKKHGVSSWGIEASPLTHFVSKTKCVWANDTFNFLNTAKQIALAAARTINSLSKPRTLSEEQTSLILKNSICEQPLSSTLVLRDSIRTANSPFEDYYLLALAKHIVYSYSNLKFGPEVGISRKKKESVDVVEIWLSEIERMETDLEYWKHHSSTFADISLGDARSIPKRDYIGKVDCVITSPPYPNEKDYSRTTRLESVILGFINTKDDLRNIKKGFIRSNSKNVYRSDNDAQYISNIGSINKLSNEIEERRLELGKTSGFEKLYASVVKQYFGGMARHLSELKPYLRNGASLAYVVGDQASYFQIPIRTSVLLGEVAESIGGYRVDRVDTFRKRFATATETWLNEDVLVLKYKGD
ncbi:DNA methyltransferase [Intestinimonas butyriciproducens]|uniref:site-specific DNA-methyltransferase (cytosine-N(4)-specific) n=1 Tax=Intestinimonas butyriciproducens TaxID=1297617 RepID=A0A0S2W3P2_9FIRM|nr:DNA methyltransferase [Intestinimonas butyriciproducens]ALP93972.1 DNA modification methyltransferase [Intestinimonas butyriciproducens]